MKLKIFNTFIATYTNQSRMFSSLISLIQKAFFLLTILIVGCVETQDKPSNVTRPNVIVFYTDDMNFDDLGCYTANFETPNIDRLARQGVKFTRYIPSTSLCSPSRYSVLTGRYASRSDVLPREYPYDEPVFIRWNTDIIQGDKTIAHLMKNRGYVTGFTGKWHNWAKGSLPLWHVPDHEDPENPLMVQKIEKNYQLTLDTVKLTSGFDYVGAVYATNFNWLPITSKLMYHNQHWITHHSLQFIEENKDKPFFLYTASTIPHAPAPIRSLKADPRATPAGYKTDHLNAQPSYESILERATKDGLNEKELNKRATMIWLDDAVGAIVDKLEKLGIRDNTLIIFASDHQSYGKMTCNLGKAPFIINWPGHFEEGEVIDELISNIDVVPTVLEASGAPQTDVKLDGISLLPLINDTSTDWRSSLYMEVTYTRGVATKDYKYIATRFPSEIEDQITSENRHLFTQEGLKMKEGEGDRYNAFKKFPGYFDNDQLYDLRKDSLEQNNLAGDPEYAQVMTEMKAKLKAYSADLPYAFGEFSE